MTREDDFSVVVFAKNTSGLYRTYRNIKQNPLADTIQILAVRVEGNADQFSQSDLKELQLLGEKEKTLQAQARLGLLSAHGNSLSLIGIASSSVFKLFQ